MSIKGGDYSVARPDPASLFNHGWRFVCRYLRDLDKSNGDKSLSKDEADSLRRAGLTIVSNDETTADRGLRGYDAGVFDAGEAHAAHVRCGAPKARPIYFSPWDHDPAGLTREQKATVFGYLRGCIQVLGIERVGLYAGVDLVREAFDQHLISYGWEAAGWRHGKLSDPRTHIIQHVTASWQVPGTDANEAVKADYGQWDVITLADAATILQAITDQGKAQTKAINEHSDELYRLAARGELPSGDHDGRESIVSLATRLAVLESAVQSGMPVNLTDEQFDKLANLVATKLSASGLKMSGTMQGTIDLGADA